MNDTRLDKAIDTFALVSLACLTVCIVALTVGLFLHLFGVIA